MDHNLGIVLILTIGFGLASLLGYLTHRIHLSSILGYLLAGFIIGPFSPGYVADLTIAEQLAEIGVILMLFSVGMHFKLEDLIKVKNIAIPGAFVQTGAATCVGAWIVYSMGWTLQAGLIIGLAIGVASTVVLVRVLFDNHLLETPQGHIAVGWLVVEDIFTVLILIMLPTLATFSTGESLSVSTVAASLALVSLKFILLALFMFTWGHRIVDFILTSIARVRSNELFTLTVLALVFLIATGSAIIFGTSIALGAFIAGMVIGKTNLKHQAAANALPLKDIFAIVFFLTVGMLFNPVAVFENLPMFLGVLAVILIVKPMAAFGITLLFGYSLQVALTVSFALSQIGEFSFILAEEAMRLQILPETGYDILVACALITISLNPILFKILLPLENALQKMTFLKSIRATFPQIEQKQVFPSKIAIVGFGPIGRKVSSQLNDAGFSPVIIEQNIDTVAKDGINLPILFGDAAHEDILKASHVDEARLLIITIPDTAKAIEIIHAARHLNPAIRIIARTRFISEQPLMDELNVQYVCCEEESLQTFSYLVQELVEQLNKV